MENLRCPSCGEPGLRQLLNIMIDMPLERKITKARLRRSDVEILAAHWDKRIIYCPGCAWTPEKVKAETEEER